MQHALPPTSVPTIWAELAKRGLLALFMLLSFRLFIVVLQPVQQGDIKLVMVSLGEIAMMVVLGLFFDRSRVGRDINEFNCYALLTHLVYLPAYYWGVQPTYHNETIKLIMVLVVARLLYFGPRTADGDFAGLPVFGLLGHLQATMAKRQERTGQWLRHLPTLLFFGSALPLWLIIARTNDPVIATTAIGLMAFNFAMAMKMQREKDALLRDMQTGPAIERAPLAAPPTTPAAPAAVPAVATAPAPQAATASDTPADAPSAHDMAALVVRAFQATHPDIQPLLAAANVHLAQAFPLHPLALSGTLLQRRKQMLDTLNHLMLIAKQMEQRQANIDPHTFARLGVTFSQIFEDRLNTTTIAKYAAMVRDMPILELGDTDLFLACEVLTLAWLSVILHENNEYLDGMPEIKRLTLAIIEKYWPDEEYGAED